jgi:hypothetical protein
VFSFLEKMPGRAVDGVCQTGRAGCRGSLPPPSPPTGPRAPGPSRPFPGRPTPISPGLFAGFREGVHSPPKSASDAEL